MAKRGPKRKKGDRYPSGQLKVKQKPLEPTRELIARRVARLVIAGVNPAKNRHLANTGMSGSEQPEYFRLAASWLGVLFAAGVIDQFQLRAGNKYHEIYKAAFPQGFPGSALDLDMPRFGDFPYQAYEQSSSSQDDVGLQWALTEKILSALGRRVHELVKSICVYGRFERFIDVSSPRPLSAWRADAEDRTRFVAGLDALAQAYGYGQKVAA